MSVHVPRNIIVQYYRTHACLHVHRNGACLHVHSDKLKIVKHKAQKVAVQRRLPPYTSPRWSSSLQVVDKGNTFRLHQGRMVMYKWQHPEPVIWFRLTTKSSETYSSISYHPQSLSFWVWFLTWEASSGKPTSVASPHCPFEQGINQLLGPRVPLVLARPTLRQHITVG